jgi:hypothetical protein
MDARQWNGSDERDLSQGPGEPHKAFRQAFRFFQRKGLADDFLAVHRGLKTFAADVAWAEQQLLIELDVLAGEK